MTVAKILVMMIIVAYYFSMFRLFCGWIYSVEHPPIVGGHQNHSVEKPYEFRLRWTAHHLSTSHVDE